MQSNTHMAKATTHMTYMHMTHMHMTHMHMTYMAKGTRGLQVRLDKTAKSFISDPPPPNPAVNMLPTRKGRGMHAWRWLPGRNVREKSWEACDMGQGGEGWEADSRQLGAERPRCRGAAVCPHWSQFRERAWVTSVSCVS